MGNTPETRLVRYGGYGRYRGRMYATSREGMGRSRSASSAVVSSLSVRDMGCSGGLSSALALDSRLEKKRCMEMKTMATPMKKLMLRSWPKSAHDMSPVKMVATVEEYFFRIVSANCRPSQGKQLVEAGRTPYQCTGTISPN
jgi:hypothetical protein